MFDAWCLRVAGSLLDRVQGGIVKYKNWLVTFDDNSITVRLRVKSRELMEARKLKKKKKHQRWWYIIEKKSYYNNTNEKNEKMSHKTIINIKSD